MGVSSFLQAGPANAAGVASPAASPPSMPPAPPQVPGAAPGHPRSPTVTLIAGVGVLLLAMGVGVLIGRASAPKQAPGPAQVITLASGPSAGGPSPSAEETFTGDWPSGKTGYAVQLQTLPQTGTTVKQVEAAKSAATAKGASSVGALKSEEFSSLASGDYVVYSGEFHKRSEADKALGGLKRKFPGASVIKVSNGSGSSPSGSSSSGGSKSGAGSSIEHPASSSVLEGESKAKGKSYEEKSKNLPNVVETG